MWVSGSMCAAGGRGGAAGEGRARGCCAAAGGAGGGFHAVPSPSLPGDLGEKRVWEDAPVSGPTRGTPSLYDTC